MVKVVIVQRDEMKRSRSRLCEEVREVSGVYRHGCSELPVKYPPPPPPPPPPQAVLEGSGEPHVKHRRKKEKEMKKAVARDSSESTPPNGTTVLPTAGMCRPIQHVCGKGRHTRRSALHCEPCPPWLHHDQRTVT